MKQRLYSIRDNKVGFMQPVIRQNDAVAIRDFVATISLSGSDSMLKLCPEDFDLFYVGTFDDETGELEHVIPVFLETGYVSVLTKVKEVTAE